MILKSSPAKLNLPLISNPAPVYSSPGKGSENYNRNKLPSGLELVKISIPAGYTVSSTLSPEVVAKAQSLLGKRNSENLPFNYGESFFVEENGKVNEYLALITLHFDNHPRRFLELPDGSKKPHPPFWHSGVSIFKKTTPSSMGNKKIKRKKKIKKEKLPLRDESFEGDIEKDLETLIEKSSSTKLDADKIYLLTEEFNNLIMKLSN